jgi:hypothetical protein
MRRKLTTLLAILAVICLTTTAAFAGSIHFSGAISFSSGSLIAEGRVSGLAATRVTVTLDARATVTATCANPAGKQVPGQKAVSFTGSSSDTVDVDQNGSSSFYLEAPDPTKPTAKQAGCPSGFHVSSFFVNWTGATISVFNADTGAKLLSQEYTCITTSTDVNCQPK